MPGLIALYARDEHFRSTISMERYRFGAGEYRYFDYPLPSPVQELRESLYSLLAPIANNWMEALGSRKAFPLRLDEFLLHCRAEGQSRATPLILRYEAGGYNCLHQDLYGELAFPFQVVCLLSRPGRDFSGGEFVLLEQRPRSQSKVEVVPFGQGDGIIFTNAERPEKGRRGYYRVKIRHGASRITRGVRYASV
jgi:hypothetical protein